PWRRARPYRRAVTGVPAGRVADLLRRLPNMMRLTVLGATGSIGDSTLDVVRSHPDKYRVFALTANAQADKLAKLCREFRPRMAVLGSAAAAQALREQLGADAAGIDIRFGTEALEERS